MRTRGIDREIHAHIEPTPSEMAQYLCEMDSDELADMLEDLSMIYKREQHNVLMQMEYITDDIVYDHKESFKDIGRFIDEMHEYLGYNSLLELFRKVYDYD